MSKECTCNRGPRGEHATECYWRGTLQPEMVTQPIPAPPGYRWDYYGKAE